MTLHARIGTVPVYTFELEHGVTLSDDAHVMLIFLRRGEPQNAIPVALPKWKPAVEELIAKGFVESWDDENGIVLAKERKVMERAA